MMEAAFTQIVIMPLLIGVVLGLGTPWYVSWRVKQPHY